jgi:ElaB/YqjD/DUF883 family membrane-anchored ribosome-binding protein
MADNPEVIRRQMDETKAHLAEKLEALESQVTSTVQSATDVVTETVETVKGTVENVTEAVQETVHSVSEAFNLKRQFDRHPWGMLGGSVAVGCLVGYLTSEYGRRNGESKGRSNGDSTRMTSRMSSVSGEETAPREPERRSFQSEPSTQTTSRPEEPAQKGWFYEELGRVKNLALGVLMGAVRDLTVRSLPGQLGHKVAEEVDHLTTNLGAEPIRGPVLPDGK